MTQVAAVPNQKVVHPLRVRDFRLLWIGESISLLGDQFYLIALPWLVLQVTGSALALGTVLALASVPRALFMLIGGAMVDRFSPRSVMFISNLSRMIVVGLLALFILTDTVQVWMLYLLALAFGTADAFYFPAQSSMVPALLNDEQLEMGNTLTQGMAMLSMFVGPVIAGVIIAALAGATSESAPGMAGIGVALLLDGTSFLASLIVLSMIRPRKSVSDRHNVVESIKEGMSYVWNSRVLRMVFILLIAINLLITGPFEVGIPVLADRNLAEGATAFGILMSAYGGGALLGIILAGMLPKPKGVWFGSVIMLVIGLLGVSMILLTISTSTPVVALISMAMGTTMGYVNINFMTWLQRRIPSQLMGRVMSLIMFASVGIAPVSSTMAGIILNVDLHVLFIGAGALMALVALWSATTPAVRQMGLEAKETDKKESIAEIVRSTRELPALRSTSSMPAIRL